MAKELWGISNIGFYRPTLEEIIAEKEKEAKQLFGEDIECGELSVLGKYIRINAADDMKIYEEMEALYYNNYPDSASGVSLDRICERVALHRSPASHATHKIKVYGTKDYEIEVATIFTNIEGVVFTSIEAKTITTEEVSGNSTVYYAEVIVQCVDSGTVGNVTNIDRTEEYNENISKVVYVESVSEGEGIESDVSLRKRYKSVVQGLGSNTTKAIVSNLLRLSDVKSAFIIDNNTTTADVVSSNLTIAAKSYGVLVYANGTPSDEIAKAIYERQPLGIVQSGNVSKTVEDDSGEEHTVKFSYVQHKTVNATIACNVSQDFPNDGVDTIKAAIEDFLNSAEIGENIVYSQLYGYIYKTTGVVKVTEMKLNNTQTDISVARDEKAVAGTITVTTTEV